TPTAPIVNRMSESVMYSFTSPLPRIRSSRRPRAVRRPCRWRGGSPRGGAEEQQRRGVHCVVGGDHARCRLWSEVPAALGVLTHAAGGDLGLRVTGREALLVREHHRAEGCGDQQGAGEL